MVHQLWPQSPERTLIQCDWFFHPEAFERDRFSAGGCDRVLGYDEQTGLACVRAESAGDSFAGLRAGPYSPRESIPAAWDRYCSHENLGSPLLIRGDKSKSPRPKSEVKSKLNIQTRHERFHRFEINPLWIAWDVVPGNWVVFDQPPAIAPMMKKGSLPLAIASGNGASGSSCEKSSPQQKKRTSGRRFLVV